LYILKLKTLETKILVALEKFAEAHPDVIYMTKSYGAWDVKIGVNVPLQSERDFFLIPARANLFNP
jgi:hypothetical protein